MGNKLGKNEDEFQKMVKSMKNKQNPSAGNQTKITINPQQKYLSIMIQKLFTSNLPQQLKNKISLTLHQKLSKQQLIKTVSIANVLKNNEFDIESSKSTIIPNGKKDYTTHNVKFNFDLNKINPYIKKNLLLKSAINGVKEITQADLDTYERQLTEEDRKKIQEEKQLRDTTSRSNFQLAVKILRQEIKKMYHPFWKLNKAFADYVSNEFSAFLNSPQSGCHRDHQKYEGLVRKLLLCWCLYLDEGCLYPYKKWLIAFLQLPQAKISKAVQQMLMQQIFTINNSYLYHTVMMIVSEHLTPLKINVSMLNEQQDYITPELFLINDKLQIQGNFFISIYECSELQGMIQKPQKILRQLELLKNCICKDIDLYYRLAQTKQYYEIDSDNILGIVNYILTRIPFKIQGIYKQIIFMRVVYGDAVYHSQGISSYMLSTLSGSMEFLQSEEFIKMVKENPLASKKPISPPTRPKEVESLTTEDEKTMKDSISTPAKPDSPHSNNEKIKQFLNSMEKNPLPKQ